MDSNAVQLVYVCSRKAPGTRSAGALIGEKRKRFSWFVSDSPYGRDLMSPDMVLTLPAIAPPQSTSPDIVWTEPPILPPTSTSPLWVATLPTSPVTEIFEQASASRRSTLPVTEMLISFASGVTSLPSTITLPLRMVTLRLPVMVRPLMLIVVVMLPSSGVTAARANQRTILALYYTPNSTPLSRGGVLGPKQAYLATHNRESSSIRRFTNTTPQLHLL